MNRKALACMAFVFNALLFGTYYAISKEALGHIDPILFTFFEMITLAPVAVGLLIWRRREITRTLLKRGFLLGSSLCLALFTISIGLMYTTATCTAFFPSLNGFLAVFLAWTVLRQPVAKTTWIAGVLSVVGSILLIVNASLGGLRGSLIALLGNLFFTGYVFLAEREQKDVYASWALLGMELLTMALWATLIMLLFGDWSTFHPQLPKDAWVILYVAGACTLLPTLITILMQKYVSPLTISFIYIVEPVFGATLAFFYLHEVLPSGGYLGGGLVVVGAIIHIWGVSRSPALVQKRRPVFLSIWAIFARIVEAIMIPARVMLGQRWARGGITLKHPPFQQPHTPLLLTSGAVLPRKGLSPIERVSCTWAPTHADEASLHDRHSVLAPQNTEDKMASQRMTAQRLLALLLVCVTLGMLTSLLFIASGYEPTKMIGVSRTLPEHVSLHSLIIGGSVIATIGIAVAGILVGLALYIVNTLIRPKRQDHFIPLTPFVLDLPAEEVTFSPLHGDHLVRGIYIARQDATTTILISPGYRRTFTDVLGMCKHLWAAGHNVLAFEYYGHGSIVGMPITLGYREVNDFLGAVSYARQQAPQDRIGALGYSMGGAISIMGSARTPEVLAVVADSAFASHWSAVEMAVRQTLHLSPNTFTKAMKVLRWITDIVLAWQAGYHFHHVEPWRDIARLAPRPVLLIHGLDDTIVHPDDSVRLYEAAGRPKALWHLPGTEHIKGYFTDSVKYTTRVISFFDHYLKQSVLPTQESTADQEEAAVGILAEQERNAASPSEVEQVAARSWQEPVSSPVPVRQPAYSALGLAYGHLIYRFRWTIIALWVVLILGSLPLAGRVQNVLQNSGYSINDSESQTVDNILTSKLHQPTTQILAVFQSSATPVSDPAYQRELHDFMARAKSFAHVSSVTQAGVGKDGRSDLVVIGFDQDKDTVAQYLPAFRQVLPSAQSGPARMYLTGDSAAANETQLDTQSDTETAELIAMPLTLLALLIVFGSVVAGMMPLLLAAVAVPGSLAIIYLLALHIQTNIFIQSLASIIGLGLSIDYSLFLIRRFREELDQGCAVPDALAQTIATAGEAILFSATTVAIGFAGLLFIGIQIMTSFGIGGITVASMAALAAMTLLPAMLGVLGHRINALPLPSLRRLHRRGWPVASPVGSQPAPTFWHSWALFVMKRPVLILILMMVVLIGLGWPALELTPGLPGASSLPANSQARRGSDILTQQFPTVNQDPIDLVVQTADGSSVLTAQNTQHIAAVTQEIARQPHVTNVTSLTRVPPAPGEKSLDEQQLLHLFSSGAYQQIPALRQFVASVAAGNTTLITVRADTVAGSHDDESLIDRLRSLSPQVKQNLIVRVGGARAINLDFDRVLYGNFLRALIFILLATYVLLLFTFRSVLLPLKAILMNMLSISGAYGALVFIFQQGHFENLLGFTASGFIDRFIPILLFCVLFGLSMDYEVFLLTRMREEWLHTGNNRLAVARGLEKTGGVITSAALLFIIVSSSFTFTQLIVTKELGLGITVAVFVDATLIRSLLVPATMQLLGKWNWWFPKRPGFSSVRMVEEQAPLHDRALALPPPSAPVSQASASAKDTSLTQQVAVEQALMQIVAQIAETPPEQVRGTSDFFEYGGDSHSLDALISAIAHQWHVRVEANEVFDHPVLFDLATIIARRQQQAEREEVYA